MNPLKRPIFLIFFALMLFASIAFAEIVQVGYRQLRGTAPAADTAQDGISSVQTSNWTTTPIDPIATNGNNKIAAFVTFSDASATCELTCVLYYKVDGGAYTVLGISDEITVTASATEIMGTDLDPTGYMGVDVALFETAAANYYEIRVRAISAGDVTVVHYPFGAGVRPGE